jgi:hypothetical protein
MLVSGCGKRDKKIFGILVFGGGGGAILIELPPD